MNQPQITNSRYFKARDDEKASARVDEKQKEMVEFVRNTPAEHRPPVEPPPHVP